MSDKKITKAFLAARWKQLDKKLLAWSSLQVRFGQVCAACGAEENLNSHHILNRDDYKHLRYEVNNQVCLCPTHHKFGRLSAHKNAVWLAELLKAVHSDKYFFALQHYGDQNIALSIEELEALCEEHGIEYTRPPRRKNRKNKVKIVSERIGFLPNAGE